MRWAINHVYPLLDTLYCPAFFLIIIQRENVPAINLSARGLSPISLVAGPISTQSDFSHSIKSAVLDRLRNVT
jgi:hypothetical protein